MNKTLIYFNFWNLPGVKRTINRGQTCPPHLKRFLQRFKSPVEHPGIIEGWFWSKGGGYDEKGRH